MILIAAGWISILLLLGGIGLDRTLTALVTNQFDDQLGYSLNAMLGSAEIDPEGEVYFNRPLGDQRFLEPNSGFYWQISGEGHEDWRSRSLWDRQLEGGARFRDGQPHYYDSDQFSEEPLRMVERTISLPGSETEWHFVVAGSRDELDQQISDIRSILAWSFAILGIGLFLMAGLQTWYGLSPLRRVRRAIVRIRTTGRNRVTDPLPLEVQPMVEELNALLEHSEKQAEEARRHAGNLAHALKTPLTVLTNAASAHSPDLDATVLREAATMRRQVDHHLARARAVGRRAVGMARTNVMASADAVERAVARLYPNVRFDIDGSRTADVAIERQDLDEILGNLVENAAKYGGGSVFVTVDAEPNADGCAIWVEDDGLGIPESKRDALFSRGARLDTEKPGTGLGLAIVRDVTEIYGGSVELGESEDLGGLLVKLVLPRGA
ncbi:histidine kinase [Altererythrobacter salegens]|uniref:histidine kinase n=1 Tax=Croceibacterium salegens TaxID=1737568 RepID=A0A6I4SWR9_9SPHN|nr:HAMP domain-containing sensor histidine kinase [Croceibacterium salegens]MXO59487.1 histidine kinase [Croceibacterium salegens]